MTVAYQELSPVNNFEVIVQGEACYYAPVL